MVAKRAEDLGLDSLWVLDRLLWITKCKFGLFSVSPVVMF